MSSKANGEASNVKLLNIEALAKGEGEGEGGAYTTYQDREHSFDFYNRCVFQCFVPSEILCYYYYKNPEQC